MKKLILVCCVVLFANSPVHAQVREGFDIYINTGYSLPSGGIWSSDVHEPGYNFGFGFGKFISGSVSLIGYYEYNRFPNYGHYSKSKYISLNVKYSFIFNSRKFIPYCIGGFGLLSMHNVVNCSKFVFKSKDYYTLGMNTGIGFELRMSEKVNMFVEGKYSFGFVKNIKHWYFPVKFGLKFSLPKIHVRSIGKQLYDFSLFGKVKSRTKLYINSGVSYLAPIPNNKAVSYGGGLEMELKPSLCVRFSYDYYGSVIDKSKIDKLKTISTKTITINLKFNEKISRKNNILMYFLFGLGLHNRNYNRFLYEVVPGIIPFPDNKTVQESKWGMGMNLGLGLEKPVSNRFNVFIEGNYLLGIFIEESYLYFPIKCGFTFDL